ncbi:carbohydrate ABC transporter permease [Bifidobacterium psychraerophilum]|uniref:carbohydrate ABC transporter permease n=1 Tax=Bifidobacterium psychraerophilum TaxID=218140 RepID=UPI0023F126CC|nr:carbohydrate ABC transporter permease [Bifidobacterium psychraerophilum]MCI1659731.1 carbohydrate ABC transporter permease [Bifidobacterium psychraerophilum]MCI1804712.1 carbohydrate ABC transporter permease [Bifidobacterium psychraerophilum]MCI2176862.1 carbohydrate ABC transporter permease [Bifidobacterium psychraerophilum]MCI2182181.1 carbohydrate ABC transporter permease [Bifidobacterium psychraerophilum]
MTSAIRHAETASRSADTTGKGKGKGGRRVGHALAYLFLGAMIVAQLLPFWLALSAASKPSTDMSSTLVPRLHDIAWDNFTTAITQGGILTAVGNSVIVTVCSTVLVCICGAAAAYPLARRKTRGNKLVSAGIMSLMMVPPLSILVPLYTLMVNTGGVNTRWGIVLVTVAGNLPLAIFLYTAFIKAVPESIDEAGMIDGASRFMIFIRLILPLLKPVTATVVIMTSVGVWNEYALSNYLISDPSKQLIAPRVASFFAMQSSNLGVGAASALIAALPIVIVYLFLQRYFIAGIAAGAEK